MRETKQTGSFLAQDADGLDVKIVVLTEYLVTKSASGEKLRTPRCVHLRTADGCHVYRLERGRYQIVDTGELLNTDDPAEPPE